MVRKYTIHDMKTLANEKGGSCVSDEYINQLTKLKWICNEGHEWEAMPKHILKGSWCPKCARFKENRNKYPVVGIEEMRQIATDRGGDCLSDNYINKSVKLSFRCKEGHIFETSPSEILRGNWCSTCSGMAKKSITKMKEFAEKRGGKCLSDEYKNVFSKLKWQCENGHEFEAIPKHILNGHWCPNCTIYTNEERCRFVFEQLFDKKFIKTRTVLNNNYELDGYNEELKLAFEYHGKQHYENVEFFYSRGDMDLQERFRIDKDKENQCIELGITLIIIPYTVNHHKLIEFIVCELNDKFSFSKDPASISFEDHILTQSHLKEIKDIAADKGGKCLSDEYINVDTKMLFICQKGHKFSTTPYRIKKMGNWCRKCFEEDKAGASQRLNSNEMYIVAESKGWKCLSTDYKNARQKLDWECDKGHKFKRALGHVKEGRGCPKCLREKRMR